MKRKMNLCAVAAFACAMTPNLIAVSSILRGFLQPHDPGSMEPRSFGVAFALLTVAMHLLLGFVGMPNYVTGPLGAAGIVLAVIALRRSGLGGKPLAAVALILGISEVALVSLRLTI